MYPLPHDHGQAMEQLTHMPKPEDFQAISRYFTLLGDSSRVRIFWVLCHCRECVTNLSAMVEMSAPAVSHHLRQLKNAGLVESRREGKEVYYAAAHTPVARLLHDAIEEMEQITCPGR